MSFSGFDRLNNLEAEKRKFLEGGLAGFQDANLATFVWGEESYDGLGDALQEGGDELNDETFGGTGAVGKDFDFTTSALSLDHRQPVHEVAPIGPPTHLRDVEQRNLQQAAPARSGNSLESIWDDKSPFSVLPKMNGSSSRHTEAHIPASTSGFSPFGSQTAIATTAAAPSTLSSREPVALSIPAHQTHGVRTLEEIEAEMREAFAAQRNQNVSPSQSHALSQVHHRATPQRHIPPQHAPTPPPRMHPHSQSPRFHQQQQQHQILLLQQQQQRQLEQDRKRQLRQLQQLQLLELQEQQLRQEEAERQRQLLAQQAQLGREQQYIQQHQRHVSTGRLTPSMVDLQQRQYRHHSPAPAQTQQQVDLPFQQSLQYLPRDIQMQQRMLAEMAQAEFLNNMQGSGSLAQQERVTNDERGVQEVLRQEAVRKIMEAERMEEKRRRKLEKIRYMSRYNDLMTQSDKDFITRIQVSQLVTQDPYADDFYAQVYGAVMRSRMGVSGPEAVLKFGSGGGVGLGLSQGRSGRRPSAMQRMEAQVERIVNNARLREKEKTSLNSLQGALGKTAGRSYKAAPRQLLQVDSSANGPGGSPTLSHATAHAHISKADAIASHQDGAGVAAEAAKFGKQALGEVDGTDLVRRDPLTHREALIMLERLYDLVLDLEHQKREEPAEDDEEGIILWEEKSKSILENLWDSLQVMVPLDTSDPHPFISLLTPSKGKKLLPRVTRHFSTQQSLTLLTLLVACFSQLDVVVNAKVLDSLEETLERKDVDAQTQAFLGSVMQSLLPIAATASLRLVSGILGLFLERNEVGHVSRTKPGIAMLTMFLSRVEVIKQNMTAATDPSENPSPEEATQWQIMFDHLFSLLAPHLAVLFPSVRQARVANIPYLDVPDLDTIDQPVWQFLAALGLNASLEQQQILVTSLRERVLENVTSAVKGWVSDEETRKMRLANVNIFLHALGLDSSQIAL